MDIEQNVIKERYQLLTDTEDLVAISTPQRVRKFVNRSYCSFFGKAEGDLVGSSFTTAFSEEKKRFYQKFIEKMNPETPTISTIQLSGLPGKEKWIHWKETGVFDKDGNLKEVLSVGRDVDEIVRIRKDKEALLKMLGVYRQAIDTNILSSITDPKGVITYANNKFCEVSQYTRKELIGNNHSIVNSGHHSKSFFSDMWKTILAGKMWRGEIKNRAKDGSFYWVDTVIMPIKEDRNGVNGFLSLRIQIDEKKRMEEERETYVKSLEDMLFMVSHEFRKPVVTCEGLLNLMQEAVPGEEEYRNMVSHLMDSAKELNYYSRKLNDYLQNNILTARPKSNDQS